MRSSASPMAAAPTWCSIPSAAQIFEDSVRCIAWGARLLVIGFTGGIGLARTNLLLIKGASVLGVRAGEAVRRNPALGEARIEGSCWNGRRQGKIRPNVSHRLPLEDYAAGDAAADRPQGDRAGGADDVVVSSSLRERRRNAHPVDPRDRQ